MKRNVRRVLAALLSAVLLASLLVIPAAAEEEPAEPSAAEHTVWLVGDSTVSAFDDSYYYPRYGYGTQIGNYLDDTYAVQNLAVSGTSSKSFTANANSNYTTLFDPAKGIKAGDTLIIGFGHNDEKAEDPARYTSPTGNYKTDGSFAHSLYENYISKARAAGAEVIVCTPIVRRTTGSWSNNTLHVANGGSYPEAIKTMLSDLTTDEKATGVTVVDLTTITKDLYDKLTPAETLYLHAWTSSKETSVDNTHLNVYGAKVVARALLEAVQKDNDTELAKHVVLGDAPTKEGDLKPNSDYKETSYEPPTTSSTQCEDYVAGDVHFKGTAMGNLGGTPTATNQVRETDSNGNMHIKVNSDKGKITGDFDGIAMYYYAVPAGKTFTLSARAKVNGVGTTNPNQAAFGLMARDDMHIDKRIDTLNSDYVVAGTFGDSSANCFRRKSNTLEKPATLSTPIEVGKSYDLSIVSNSDGYTCTFGDEAPQSAGYDFPLTAVDSEYVYVGMFCARSFDVTFSNIVLTVDGVTLCDTTAAEEPFDFVTNGLTFTDAEGKSSETAVEGGKLAAISGALSGNEPGAMGLVAVYDVKGKMTGLKVVALGDGNIPVDLPMNGGETAKVFVVNKTSMTPYKEAYSETSGVAPVDPDDKGNGPVQVWDFGGKVEENTDLYTNNITPDTLKNAKLSSGGAVIEGGTIKTPQNTSDGTDFGGVVFTAGNNDKFFSNIAELAGLAGGNATATHAHTFDDGYTSAGGFITNGDCGSGNRRYITVKAVKAGELVSAYLSNNQSDVVYAVANHPEIPTVSVAQKGFGVLKFVAPTEGDYKIFASSGKPGYLRVTVTPAVAVSGKITLPADFPKDQPFSLKFTNQDTKAVTEVALAAGATTYEAALAPGYTYGIALSGVGGYGPTTGASGTKYVTPAEADVLTGQTHDITIEAKSTYTYSGAITGFAEGYDTSNLAVTMEPDADSAAQGSEPVELTLDGMNFTATLEPGVNYTVSLAGVNDYQVKSPEAVTSEGTALTGQTIVVEPKPTFAATGKFVTLDEDDQFAPLYDDSTYDALDASVTKLTFENVEDGYTYDATVADGGYTVSLRAGAYLAKATVDGYATKTHVVVEDAATEKDLLFVTTGTPAAVSYAADVYVGDESKGEVNFNTVTGALAYISRMTRTDGQRVTVHIAPGTYREQIAVETPNVTFVNTDPSKEVKLTWYYGIGYTYYSASGVSGTDSWYDPQLAFDRFAKPAMDVARWGATVRVRAAGFQAEGITFENSFNRYITDEELADGVELAGTQSIAAKREYDLDVTSKAATERAAAIWMDSTNKRSDMAEFKNCKFYSSQDTVGTGKRMYFKDCYIEGMTDYICGPGDVVFDTCVLNWKGYSDSDMGGYLTAPRTAATEKGYLFRNCYITGNSAGKLGAGAFGRPWSGADAAALFVNTRLASAGLITDAGWAEMDGKKPADAKFGEYNTTLADGSTAVDTSKRVTGTVRTEAPTEKPADYFGDWTPTYYAAEVEGVALDAAPAIHDNGDPNLPYPGHTLTVSYTLTPEANNANDDSLIQWYRVKDGAETLVKTAAASADKTYQIQTEDVGAQIKVTVTPRTIGGQTGEAKSTTTKKTVLDGYDDPSNPVDPVLGTGVNIFLAGDSTVKDYSVNGMWTKGVNQVEGSWGEWLQKFLDDKVTVVDYAQGGRTTRSFIEQDKSLEKIDENMKEGDFLFIQFGHNDCYTGDDRYVPLGIAKNEPQKSYAEGGSYPDTVNLASDLFNGETLLLSAGTHTTYTGYLKQYLEVAKKHNATAVLMTPVARMQYNTADGSIKPHHDATAVDGTSDNEYCKAVKWVYDWAVARGGYKVVFIDNYQLTADLFTNAYKACNESDKSTYGHQLMSNETEGTHNNKLGGFLWAGLVAKAIQNSDMTIAKAVKAPSQVLGKTDKDQTAFLVDGQGRFTAYDMLEGYAQKADYWQTTGQQMLDAIAAKAAELAPAPAE